MIELACGDHGNDKIEKMAKEIENGKCLAWTGHTDFLAINDTPSGIEYYFLITTKYSNLEYLY